MADADLEPLIRQTGGPLTCGFLLAYYPSRLPRYQGLPSRSGSPIHNEAYHDAYQKVPDFTTSSWAPLRTSSFRAALCRRDRNKHLSLPKTPSGRWSSRSTLVSMMEFPDFGERDDLSIVNIRYPPYAAVRNFRE